VSASELRWGSLAGELAALVYVLGRYDRRFARPFPYMLWSIPASTSISTSRRRSAPGRRCASWLRASWAAAC
jgi:hypothetical protein